MIYDAINGLTVFPVFLNFSRSIIIKIIFNHAYLNRICANYKLKKKRFVIILTVQRTHNNTIPTYNKYLNILLSP